MQVWPRRRRFRFVEHACSVFCDCSRMMLWNRCSNAALVGHEGRAQCATCDGRTMEAWSTWKGKSAGTAALVHVPSDPISPGSSALISIVQTDTASTCPVLEGGGEESLHELDQSDEVRIRSRKTLWFLLLTIEYAGFAALTLRFFPQNWGSANHWVEHILTFVLHVVYMDLILNWLTGLLLHRISWLRTNLHRSEHAMIKEGKLHHLMQVAFFYGLWTLLHMVAFGLGIACTSPSNHSGCWNWQSTMWVASFAYSLIGLLLRFWFWFAQGSADMCTGSPMMLNLALFYWAHFNPESEWEDEVVFGSVTPFWDVLLVWNMSVRHQVQRAHSLSRLCATGQQSFWQPQKDKGHQVDYAAADVVRHVGCCSDRPVGFAVFASGRRIFQVKESLQQRHCFARVAAN